MGFFFITFLLMAILSNPPWHRICHTVLREYLTPMDLGGLQGRKEGSRKAKDRVE